MFLYKYTIFQKAKVLLFDRTLTPTANQPILNDLLYQIALTKIPSVGAVTAKNLISYCGGTKAVFHASKKELLRIPGIGALTADKILNQTVLEEAEEEIKFIEEHDIQTFFYLDEDYPTRLTYYNDSPTLLYYKGTASLNNARVLAIVGTRKPTPQGVAICQEIVEQLKPYNVVIVSGLAYGIDVTAHRTCVESGIETIGVMGNGLGSIYPAQHRQVAERMSAHGGLLTEYSHQIGPDREHFPARNRIIAGLCDALLVVETERKGGSMISAYKALDYHKEVFAVPGRVKDRYSLGCNFLIRTNRAALVESAEQIAQEMNWEAKELNQQPTLFQSFTPEEQQIVDALREKDQVGLDELSYTINIPTHKLAGLLLELEFRNVLKSLPGKRYLLL